MSNNYNKQNDRVKWIATALAGILLAGACITSIVMGVKHNGWFQKAEPEQKQEQTDPATPDKEATGGMIATPTSTRSMRLLATPLTASADDGISSQAEDGYTITATVYTDEDQVVAGLQKVTFSMAWASENSAAVTDYVTMETTDTSATFTCKQAFGTQIVVTVTSVIDPSVSATATLDYYQRPITPAADTVNFAQVDFSGAISNAFDVYKTPTYGVGSHDNKVTSFTVEFSASESFMKALKTYSNGKYGQDSALSSFYTLTNSSSLIQFLIMNKITKVTIDAENKDEVFYYWQRAVANTTNQITAKITVNLTYGEAVTYTRTINMTATDTQITSVNLSGTTFIF